MAQTNQEHPSNSSDLANLFNGNPLVTPPLDADLHEAEASRGQDLSDDYSDIINEFLIESYENLDQLDRDLLILEKDPTSQQTLASVFRTIHTIKGTCGFFGYTKLESVTHIGENLLGRLRDGRLTLNSEIATSLLALVDAIRQMLNCIENEHNEGNVDYSSLIADLTRLQQDPSETSPLENPGDAIAEQGIPQQVEAEPVIPTTRDAGAEPPVNVDAEPVLPAAAAPLQSEADGDLLCGARNANESRGAGVAENSIRVDVGLLDVLMNLVGELVLARNQILQYTSTQNDSIFAATSQRLNLITTELQEGVMKTRMQPIGNIWNKFPRVVRDLATSCGKKIAIEMEGKETEMDKTIIEAIKDPLTHLVRNSADHGIETPEARIASGKPAEGRIFLRALHEGGQVNIEISDDGAGIDAEKVKRKALQRGLITSEHAARMSDREATNLIFLPGFSTAEKVTNISGRGVGMDVVKTNIEKIGGTIDIQSKPGQGTTIKIKIPLTLAIIPALIITSGSDRYAIPQVSLLELVRLEGEQARTAIEYIYGAPVYRLRGSLLPLVDLNRELQVERQPGEASASDVVNIVVLRADDQQFGLVVDEINDTEEIVVKPLGKQLKGISCFAGATIMGDGRVALILDVLGLAQKADIVSEVRDTTISENDSETKLQGKSEDRQTLMLFRIGDRGRMAIPLSLVARLEEFPSSAIEQAGSHEVVQYRGQIMPLIRLSHLLNYDCQYEEQNNDALLQVVVYTDHQRSVGLIVDQILDIVDESVLLERGYERDGVLGAAVIGQRVTDLLDIQGLLQRANPFFFEQSMAA